MAKLIYRTFVVLTSIIVLSSCSNFLETEDGNGEAYRISTVQTDMKPIQGLHISGASITAQTTDMNGTAVVKTNSAEAEDRIVTISDIDGPANGTYQTQVITLLPGDTALTVQMPSL